jgi:hypothetical protein
VRFHTVVLIWTGLALAVCIALKFWGLHQ